jgi:vacuolar protein sorting-associated protein 8
LEAEVEEKGNVEAVAEPAEQTVAGSGVKESEEDNSEPTNLREASTVDPVVKEEFNGLEETIEDGDLAETDEVEDQSGVVNEENEDSHIADDDYVESIPDADLVSVVPNESSDDDQGVETSDSVTEEQAESESIIDKMIEERMEQLEINKKAEKNSEKKLKASMKPLEWAEELEKRQASFGQHWEEGAAAQPMQLEGIGKGPPAIGYMQIEMDNPVTRAMASPSFRTDHGSPQVLAAHRSYIAMGTSKGAVVIIPSKYSIHQADDTDTKVSHCY